MMTAIGKLILNPNATEVMAVKTQLTITTSLGPFESATAPHMYLWV